MEVKDLKTWFPIKKGVFRRTVGYVKAVDGVNLTIQYGEAFGLVGESGCGKTSFGRTILRLIPATEGEVFITQNGNTENLFELDDEAMMNLRRKMSLIFQDPFSSLNPRMSVGDIVGEYLTIHKVSDYQDRVVSMLETVGLSREHMSRYPHEFSGGQRQRIGIARAMSLSPEFIVCDEPVSALDVSIQAQILNLLQTLQKEMNLTYLFIAHDLAVVEHLCDRVAVMYVGKIAESADAETIYRSPRHPYTEALLSAVPSYHPEGRQERIVLEGDVPSPANPPEGCRFNPRCRYAEDICRKEEPPLIPYEEGASHIVACHLAKTLDLKGIGSTRS